MAAGFFPHHFLIFSVYLEGWLGESCVVSAVLRVGACVCVRAMQASFQKRNIVCVCVCVFE